MRSITLILLIGLSLFSNPTAFALTVNRINGGANVIYIDFSVSGGVLPLELVRSYNSITAVSETNGWNGAFGWGWTSPYETTLTTTPFRHVILRDGLTGNTVIFKPQKEDPSIKENFFSEVKKAYFEHEKGRKVPDDELSKLELPQKFLSRLKSDPLFRSEIALRYSIKNEIPKEEFLISTEYGYQTIRFNENHWIRESGGVTQHFDRLGRLEKQVDKNGYAFLYEYSTKTTQQLNTIRSQDNAISLKLTWKDNHVVEITDNRNMKAFYTYDTTGNLTKVIDSNNQVFIFKYLDKRFPHLLTRIDYPSESSKKKSTFRKLRYNPSGLVIYHRDRDESEYNYSYGRDSSDPEHVFWTKTERVALGRKEERLDQFTIKKRPDDSKYLYKQETRIGNETTVTTYSECCGKPSQISKNGVVTQFTYHSNGLLAEKKGPEEVIKLEYDPRWKKVTKVTLNDLVSDYVYDNKGNLIKATNSKNDLVTLKYDRFGRITSMLDNKKKEISFKYGEEGKPTHITQQGVGTIQIDYDNNGRIQKARTVASFGSKKISSTQSDQIIQQVMKSFQNLLDIIRPAGIDFSGS